MPRSCSTQAFAESYCAVSTPTPPDRSDRTQGRIVATSPQAAAGPAAAWGDVATILPWVLSERSGGVGVLTAQYDSAKAWVEQLLGIAGERYLWEGGFQFGDWVDPDAPPDQPAKAKADPDLVASAYLFLSAETLARHALVLERTEDAAHYAVVAEKVRQAWLADLLGHNRVVRGILGALQHESVAGQPLS